jgi:hypothetical protein
VTVAAVEQDETRIRRHRDARRVQRGRLEAVTRAGDVRRPEVVPGRVERRDPRTVPEHDDATGVTAELARAHHHALPGRRGARRPDPGRLRRRARVGRLDHRPDRSEERERAEDGEDDNERDGAWPPPSAAMDDGWMR